MKITERIYHLTSAIGHDYGRCAMCNDTSYVKLTDSNKILSYSESVKLKLTLDEKLVTIKTICDFSYSRIYPDGSRAELWSNESARKHHFAIKHYIAEIYTSDLYQLNERYVILSQKIKSFKQYVQNIHEKQMSDYYFNHHDCFFIINRSKCFCEYHIFYINKDMPDPVNCFLNNTLLLENFVDFFHDEFYDAISRVCKRRIVPEWRKVKNIDNFTSDNNNNSFNLTKRERQIIPLLIRGNTAKECADKVFLSKRTVEDYIDNLKGKFHCHRKSDLIARLTKLGYDERVF